MNAVFSEIVLIIAIGIVIFVGLFLIGLIVDVLIAILPFLIAVIIVFFLNRKKFKQWRVRNGIRTTNHR